MTLLRTCIQCCDTHLPSEHQEPQDELEGDSPHHGPPADVTRVGREDEAQDQDDQDSGAWSHPLGGVPRVNDDEGGYGEDHHQVGDRRDHRVGKEARNGAWQGRDDVSPEELAKESDDDLVRDERDNSSLTHVIGSVSVFWPYF